MNQTPFTYILTEGAGWPPPVRPKPPLGPSVVEIVRSCALRSCFDVSPEYERRMDYPARVGTAFHRTLQSFYDKGLPNSQESAVKEARVRFEQELRRQDADASLRPREHSLPNDPTRIDRALEALFLEAIHYVESGFFPTASAKIEQDKLVDRAIFEQSAKTRMPPPVEVEVQVRSKDGLLQGRVDRVEHTSDGTIIYDFKSALRDDLPGRYQRQLQLYALMWQETRGNWPIAGYVVYPLAGKSYPVSVDPQICFEIAKESAEIIHHLQNEPSLHKLALPGDICTVCEYRPWCRPFWSWLAEEKSHIRAVERASLGFSGPITRLDLDNHRWHLNVSWRAATVRISAPEERLPHLHKAKIGQTALVLDTKMQGAPYTPLAIFSEYSELFVLQSK